jgi:hypothetical protein
VARWVFSGRNSKGAYGKGKRGASTRRVSPSTLPFRLWLEGSNEGSYIAIDKNGKPRSIRLGIPGMELEISSRSPLFTLLRSVGQRAGEYYCNCDFASFYASSSIFLIAEAELASASSSWTPFGERRADELKAVRIYYSLQLGMCRHLGTSKFLDDRTESVHSNCHPQRCS